MKEKKGLYPDKSVYTQQIGPGLCFGALALMLRFFFEVPGGGSGVTSQSWASETEGLGLEEEGEGVEQKREEKW